MNTLVFHSHQNQHFDRIRFDVIFLNSSLPIKHLFFLVCIKSKSMPVTSTVPNDVTSVFSVHDPSRVCQTKYRQQLSGT